MLVGIPKEIKPFENRVGLIPFYVQQLVKQGHEVLVQEKAGVQSGIQDEDYIKAGAKLCSSISDIYHKSELIIKVKEPQEIEIPLIQEGQSIFSFFHLPSNLELVKALIKRKCNAITYETLLDGDNLPILSQMSAIAGKLAVQIGMRFLENIHGGKGVLLGGTPGSSAGHVVILGAGIVGTNACYVASHLRAKVTLLDINLERMKIIHNIMPNNVELLYSNEENLLNSLKDADLVISGVHLVGRKAPVLIRRWMLKKMEEKSVIVDVAIDQGGTTECSRPTNHLEPTFEEEGIIHYCVPNMPSIVSKTSTSVLSHASFPYINDLVTKGIKQAVLDSKSLKSGANLWNGKVINKNLSETFKMDYFDIENIIN